jgi:lipopolysaccharide assembly protein A
MTQQAAAAPPFLCRGLCEGDMRIVLWIPALLIFTLLLGFAIKNSDPVTVRFFLDLNWHVPLVLVMFLFFLVGVALGIIGALGTLFRQRREIGRLRREVRSGDRARPPGEERA